MRKKASILVVEDESIVARDIISSIEALGYEVAGTTVSGEEAVRMAAQLRPDAVLMDIVLQGPLDGINAAERIRRDLHIPVIYLTAYSNDEILGRAKLTGPFGYLIKPFEENELTLTLEMALYKHRMEEDLRLSSELYRSLLETSRAVPWELDAETMMFTYLGPQAREILGIEGISFTGLESLLGHVPEEHAARVRDFYREAASRQQGADIEYPFDTPEGRRVWLKDMLTFFGGERDTRLRGFMLDITRAKEAETERERYIEELHEAIERIKTLQGMLPICAWCKNIRDDKGYWQQVEIYVEEHSMAEFTHSMCPECKSRMERELLEGQRLEEP